MSKEMGIIALGLWVLVLPYLGIYRSWLTILLVLTGIALMIVGFLLRGEKLAEEQSQHKHPRHARKSHLPYEENTATIVQDYSEHHPQIGSLN